MEDDRRFTFSFEAGQIAAKDLKLQIEALTARVDHISRNARVGEFEIIKSLLALNPDPAELEVLGKSLLRVAEVLPQLRELKGRSKVIETVHDHPDWLMATFADFSGDIDTLLESIEQEDTRE